MNSKEHFQGFTLSARPTHWKLIQPFAFRNYLKPFLLLFFPLKPSPGRTRPESDVQRWQGSPSPLASLSPSHGGPEVQDREGAMILGWISARELGASAGADIGKRLFDDIKNLQLATELAGS